MNKPESYEPTLQVKGQAANQGARHWAWEHPKQRHARHLWRQVPETPKDEEARHGGA